MFMSHNQLKNFWRKIKYGSLQTTPSTCLQEGARLFRGAHSAQDHVVMTGQLLGHRSPSGELQPPFHLLRQNIIGEKPFLYG